METNITAIFGMTRSVERAGTVIAMGTSMREGFSRAILMGSASTSTPMEATTKASGFTAKRKATVSSLRMDKLIEGSGPTTPKWESGSTSGTTAIGTMASSLLNSGKARESTFGATDNSLRAGGRLTGSTEKPLSQTPPPKARSCF